MPFAQESAQSVEAQTLGGILIIMSALSVVISRCVSRNPFKSKGCGGEGEMRYRISYRGLTASLDEEDYQILKERFASADGVRDPNKPSRIIGRKPCICEKYHHCPECPLYNCIDWTSRIAPGGVVIFGTMSLFWEERDIDEVNKVFKRARGILRRAALQLEELERINFRGKVINFLIKEVK